MSVLYIHFIFFWLGNEKELHDTVVNARVFIYENGNQIVTPEVLDEREKLLDRNHLIAGMKRSNTLKDDLEIKKRHPIFKHHHSETSASMQQAIKQKNIRQIHSSISETPNCQSAKNKLLSKSAENLSRSGKYSSSSSLPLIQNY